MLSVKRIFIFLLMAVLFSLAGFYSTRDNFGILSSLIRSHDWTSLVFGFVYGLLATFYLSRINWRLVIGGGIFLAVSSAIIFQIETQLFAPALILGIFLMVFDWIFENLGAKFGYWYSKGSSFFVKAVPIEVMIAAVSGGFGWILLMPKSFDIFYVLLVSIITGIGGALGENTLQNAGKMKYGNGWTWTHAFVAYFLVWVFLSLVWYFVINT